MAAVRARQMARQREISTTASRRARGEEYLKNLREEEDQEKHQEKGRARAKASLLEEQRIEQLAARADRGRLRTDYDSYPLLTEKKFVDTSVQSFETPYSVLKARRREEQYRRQSNDVREQVSKDLARARALLQEERKKDNLELARDIKGYGATCTKRSSRREIPTSILKLENRRGFDIDDDWRPSSRTRVDDRFSDLSLGRSNGVHREVGSASRPFANGTSRVHWGLGD